MMNRIILIGNGFDLAHGLKTSYKDFIRDYWEQVVRNWPEGSKKVIDRLCQISINKIGVIRCNSIEQCRSKWFPTTVKDVVTAIVTGSDEFVINRSPLFNAIDTKIRVQNWVDIEYEYYLQLKSIIKGTNKLFDSPQELDTELGIIEYKLKDYLKEIQKEKIKSELVKNCIREAIYEPFEANDISNSGKNKFNEFLKQRLKLLVPYSEEKITGFLDKYGYSYLDEQSDIESYNSQIIMKESLPDLSEPLNYPKHIRNVYDDNIVVPDAYLLPDQILFLNFNYTNTADLYIPEGSEFKVNHIHGELDNKKNPIIFGYGDELDDDYKEITKLNDNNYLKNIKSIRYLETDNYRKLLSFIDSAPFQIYIMGHSCGNSDRTLLNTLFEHENCVSIKPFFYKKPDGTDNYIEIIQNISRNFNDMRLMRDRVVNKTYCRPLVP